MVVRICCFDNALSLCKIDRLLAMNQEANRICEPIIGINIFSLYVIRRFILSNLILAIIQ